MDFHNTPKKEEKLPVEVKVEKKKGKRKSLFGWKVKLFAWFLGMCAVSFGIAQVVIMVGQWFDENKIVPHQVIEVKLSLPFTIEPRIISPVSSQSGELKVEPSPSAIRLVPAVQAQEPALLDQLVTYIHLAESTSGRAQVGLHATCKAKGMSNEFGYRALEGFCFDSEEEAVATVKDWLYRSLQVRGVPETLCRYNTGTPSDDCDYANKFLNLLADGKI